MYTLVNNSFYGLYCPATTKPKKIKNQTKKSLSERNNKMFTVVVKKDFERRNRIAQPFRVDILEEDGIWTAICDDLGLVTEADSYEGVIESAREIAPDLYELNGFGSDQEQIRLDFIQHQAHQLKACKDM
ncbi:MAG: DUF1902 domain-containing protein [Snodgrassella sp.]|uniref:DUF1902 domain-containing protein n=1 Tax=Snodgrassella sp. TaxID=2815304 RepID=UPI0025898017|nr:DUF1902 domain-containing protein [Snodgrassella sp.]MCO6514768.1 DUF1902 domain-containing protein [Snodgrassella sp.]MCO6520554.1 DUF1902 domain-containing protein [Snodgrassella sp.]